MQSLSTYLISVSGLNLHKLIAFFEKEKIYITDLERINQKKLTFIIAGDDYKKLKKSPLHKNYKIKIIKRYGLESYSRKFLSKIGLFVAIIVMLTTIINLTNKIQVVSFNNTNHTCQNGDQCIYTEDNFLILKKELENYNIKNNASIYSLPNNKELKTNLLIKFPQISDVFIERNGVQLNVNILESKLPLNQIKTDLIAEHSGIVIKTNVTSGELKVKIGDIVLKGDTLIKNTGTPAKGSVVLRSFYHENLIFNEKQITYTRTGNKTNVNNLSLLGFKLNSTKNINYKIYETEVKNKYVSVNSILPIKLNQTTYYELEKKEITLSFEKEKDRLYKELEALTETKIPVNAEIKNTTFTLKQEDSRYLITCYKETYLTQEI